MKWKISTALSELMPTSPFGITDDDYSTIQWMDSENSLPTIDVINAKIAELDDRSAGMQITYLVKQEAKKRKIDVKT